MSILKQFHPPFMDENMQLLPNTMDFTLFSRDFKEEDQLVQINFTHEWNKSMTSHCVFWNTTLLKWRTEGCWTTRHENGTTCDCNHLTSFGILFGGSPEDTPEWETHLTNVCGGISIACLIFTQIVLHMGR